MGWSIIKQPNNKYTIFSSVVDNIIYYNCSKEEVVEAFIERSVERIKEDIENRLNNIDNNNKWYKDYKEMIETITLRHGKKEIKKLKKSGAIE
jgi:guanylate kinase